MIKRPLSQEVLKLIACVAMLIDHVGACLLPQYPLMRIIGRIAFPIYCFLLAEGVFHTKRPLAYILRLLLLTVLSELPFDLAVSGGISFRHQNVMVTLLLGVCMGLSMKKSPLWLKPILILPFALLAEFLQTDYGAMGTVIIALFLLTRQMPQSLLLQTVGLFVIQLCFSVVNIQHYALAAMIPIGLYSGRKITHSRIAQWSFYLFYPVHLLILWLIQVL